ncbi:MAG TPA: glutamine--fructose-6-phosphate aminotransferase, partial [Chitinophagales bacterium]|nr:glutamine--fructose-6-phosphate aminotransferase [Chitinophagales bacterium]
MCGIIAYIGPKQAYPIIINGLRRLEYRGYDSAGVALLNGSLQIYKRQGKVQDLDNYAAPLAPHGQVGIGHTRWATHGAPNNINAHPHVSRSGKIAVIHN